MAQVTCPLIVILCAIALGLLWPAGFLARWNDAAIGLGLPTDSFIAFLEASPTAPFPTAPFVLFIFVLGAALYDQQRERRPASVEPAHDGGAPIRWLDTAVTFGICWVLTSLAMRAFGGPFMTGDSPSYLRASLNPRDSLGSHHPTATAWLLYFGRGLSLPIGASFALVSAAQITLVIAFFRRVTGGRRAAALAALLFIIPDLFLTDLSLWSEQMFFFSLAALLLIITAARFRAIHWALALFFFLLLAESRHAAIFLMPGLALAVGRATSASFRSFVVRTALAGGFFGAGWLALNYLRTGHPTVPSRASFECAQFITAYHILPLCELDSAKELCAQDPERLYLRPLNENESEWIKADHFIFRKDSPLNKLGYSQAQVCDLWSRISSSLLRTRPEAVLQLITRRTLAQLGPWEFTERGEPSASPLFRFDAEFAIDTFANESNPKVSYLLWGVWAVGVIAAVRARVLFHPVVLFLGTGALAHAFGIAINNPFRAMRYMLVPKWMLLIASLFAVCSWVRARRPAPPAAAVQSAPEPS